MSPALSTGTPNWLSQARGGLPHAIIVLEKLRPSCDLKKYIMLEVKEHSYNCISVKLSVFLVNARRRLFLKQNYNIPPMLALFAIPTR